MNTSALADGDRLSDSLVFNIRKKANPNDPNTLRELVINNLPRQITHDNIRDYFKEFGAVTKVRVDRQMHQAFVTFSTAEAHRIAMATAKIHRESRNVRVSFPDDCKQSKEVGSNDTKTSHRVLLDNLPPWTTENDIRSLFGKFGVSAKVEVDEQTRLALATFPSADTLYDAMSAAPFRLKGVNLHTYFHEDSVWSKDARRNCTTTGYLVLLGHLPPRTTENDIRSLFGKFGASAKVEVDERKHVALATFSSLGTLHEALSPEVLSLKGENLIFINEGDYGWSKEVDSNDTESSFQVLLHDLQPGTTENGLRSLMGRFGVSTKVVVDERKHEALATFSSEKAIQAVWMDYFLFKGVNLGISFPEDSEESKEKYFNPDEIRRQLILDGLPPRTTENDIRSLFGKFGVSIKVELYGWTRRALVTFSSAKARQEAVSSAPLRLKGVDLHILYPED
ncbi:hypothetical protein ECG_03511 [Echinococcus granulosus]|uniref:RNA binding protein n=1 Tax=Echinococcus granulosus TaxID=6210 RepID=A0A068WTP6_ECHGR|nr:hypothetical protein ECG_03511 [Echinococcus granulosus]CDS23542.1 RNA binding protein [Echinococcus granulosus]